MKKSTKGALAAAAAAVLLLGGAGTLAYWTSSQDVDGGEISTGELALGAPDCGAWQLDSAESAPLTYADGDPLVPGDVLTKTCTAELTAVGNHMRGTIEASQPEIDGPLDGAFVVDTADLTVNGAAATAFTEANNGQDVGITITVTFTDPGTEDNAYNVPGGLSDTLDDITLTAVQVHS